MATPTAARPAPAARRWRLTMPAMRPVSYTHLDVYKRQGIKFVKHGKVNPVIVAATPPKIEEEVAPVVAAAVPAKKAAAKKAAPKK